MPPLPRWRAALCVAVALTVLPTMAVAGPDRHSDRILGHDGLYYPSAPLVIQAPGGDMYFGMEYDYACALGGDLFRRGMEALARTARVIEESGRRAVFTVAPLKADIVRDELPTSELPQGGCDLSGLKAQGRVLNSFPDPNYVSARKPIAKDPRQTYWKEDLHWNEIGVSDWALALAHDLDPRLARLQRYRDITTTHLGFLTHLLGLDTLETGPTVEYAGKVRVRPTAGTVLPLDSGVDDVSWRSAPAGKTWPGRTLLLGDSFTMVGLNSLAPLFRHGRFLWNKNDNEAVIAQAVAESDTVVIEVYQTFQVGGPLGSAALRKALKKALREHPRSNGVTGPHDARPVGRPR